MKTTLRYLLFLLLGYSMGMLGSLVDLSKQRDRALEFIGANPPGRNYKGLEPIFGTPPEIQAKLDSLRDSHPSTESQRRDELFMITAFHWLKGEADERMRRVRSGGQSLACVTLVLLGMSFWALPRQGKT